jgi:hypothetical protein
MRLFFVTLLLCSAAMAAPISTTEPYPTQILDNHLPGTLPPEDSKIEEVIENSTKIPAENSTESPIAKVEKKSKKVRKDSIGSVMVGYQLITSWIPSKKTISYTHIFNPKWSLELEYAWSGLGYPILGIDLGSIKERRYSLLAKRYVGKTFHFAFGPYYNDFEAEVGSSILNRAGTETTSSFGAEGAGIAMGIGSRFHWKNGFTLGVDWFRLNVPLIVTEVESRILDDVSNDDDEDDIEKVIRSFNRIPTFVLLGINIGYSF